MSESAKPEFKDVFDYYYVRGENTSVVLFEHDENLNDSKNGYYSFLYTPALKWICKVVSDASKKYDITTREAFSILFNYYNKHPYNKETMEEVIEMIGKNLEMTTFKKLPYLYNWCKDKDREGQFIGLGRSLTCSFYLSRCNYCRGDLNHHRAFLCFECLVSINNFCFEKSIQF